MQKYKSIKTFERLSKIKPAVPQYELTTYAEIDQKFKDISSSNNLRSQYEKTETQEQMNNVINQLLRQWTDKVYLKEKKLKEQDIAYDNESKNIMGQKQYKWLNLETKYDELRSKLRQIVVDKINDYENQTMAIEALADRATAKKNGENVNNIKLMLTNVKIVNTRNVFENMAKFGQSKESHFLNSLGPDRMKKIKELKSKERDDPSNLNAQQKLQMKYNLAWTDEQEEIFIDQRTKTKKLFTNEVSSSNWNDLGFLPILQQINLQEKKKVQREHILNKYANGEWLTAQELQFLANTSTLLNACLDKEFFQNTANIIDKELLQNMELQLAENILCEYEEMRQATSLARLKYIKQNMIVTKEKIHKNVVEDQKRVVQQQNHEFNRRYIKVFSTVIKNMDSRGKFLEKIPEDIPGANHLSNYLGGQIPQQELINKLKYIKNDYETDDFMNVGSQSSKLKNIPTQPKVLTESKSQYLKQISRPKSSLTSGFEKEVIRHKYHPSSKLFVKQVTKDDDVDDSEYVKKIQEKKNILEEQKFHINMNSHPAVKIPSNFCNFNSGGPNLPPQTRVFDNMYNKNQPTIATAREIRAVRLLQRKLKTLYREKELRQQVQSRKKEVYYFYKDNCELMLNTIENEKGDQAIQNILLAKQIEKAKQVGRDTLNITRKIEEEEKRIEDEVQEKSIIGTRRFTVNGETKRRQSEYKVQQHQRLRKSQITSMSSSTYQQASTKATSLQSSTFSNQKNHLKQEQLLKAAQRGQLMMMLQSQFVYSAADINIQNKDGDTALHLVINKSEHEFIQWLLNSGANPNIANNLGNTPLHNAFKKDKYDIIMMLINSGADVYQINNNGQTPKVFSSKKMLRLMGQDKQGLSF